MPRLNHRATSRLHKYGNLNVVCGPWGATFATGALGDAAWTARAAERLGLSHTLWREGRPKKTAANKS